MSRTPEVSSTAPAKRRLRLGVIGTLVWDTIHGRDPGAAPVEEWGGIAYTLSGLDAALPGNWEIVPLIKVGSDLALHAREWMKELRRLAPDAALVEVPYPNNRVELRYLTSERRAERLTGGVPGWSWLGLKPLLGDLDALYINFLSGFEMDLETAQLLRQHFGGIIYGDLHMLVMAVQPGGLRTLQPLPNVEGWCRCFDLIQVNEDELTAMAPDPMALAATALANGVRSLVVTLGPKGAVYFAPAGFDRLDGWQRGWSMTSSVQPVRTARIPTEDSGATGDPTGCGDVWGATYFSSLLRGETLEQAIRAAHRAAARNLTHRGATGLSRHLRGELSLR